ncbi:MAG: hypothetical protein LBE27_08415 [Deltaproteobacteria bacterium]|jgi:Trp operon repressor|nr:hypothetical protein [Deltaproteobacteria bacterium]
MKDSDKTESIMNMTLTDLFLNMKKRIEDLEDRLSIVEDLLKKPPQRQRKQRNYQDYLKVKEAIKRGSSINGTAKMLKLPYTTVHYYATATAEIVEKLKSMVHEPEEENGDGEKIEEE